MIAYVDARPSVEPHNGLFLLTLTSGGEKTQFLITRHVLRFLQHRCTKVDVDELDNEPIPFPKGGRA